jgi:hypothetical protein
MKFKQSFSAAVLAAFALAALALSNQLKVARNLEQPALEKPSDSIAAPSLRPICDP